MKTIKVDNRPFVKNIKSVNRVVVDMYFPIKDSNLDTAKRAMLKRILNYYSDKYRDNYSFYNKVDSLYILKYSVSTLLFREVSYFRFSLILPKEGIIDEYNLEEALTFFKEAIFNTCIDEDHFDDNVFELEKTYLIDYDKSFPNNIYDYVQNEYWKYIDEKEELGLTHEHYYDLVKKITSKEVYDYYMNNIYNNNYLVYIYGNVKDKNRYIDIFNKVFKRKDRITYIKANFCNFRKDFEYSHKEEKTKYNQSVLCFNYAIKDMKESEITLFDMLYDMLDSKENALIFNELRTKNNLIYSNSLQTKKHYGFFNIYVLYNEVDYKDIINYVESAIKSLYDRDVFEECKDKQVKSLKYTLLYKEDEPFDELFSKIETKISDEIDFNKRIERVEKTSYEEFTKFLDKLVLTKTYLFTGGDNNA